MPTLRPGQRIGGYEILEFHARGGMGEIFRARQISIDREVALKLLSPDRARSDPAFARRFVEEARAAGSLNHPNIIAVHDVGRVKVGSSDEFLYFFSMEFIRGETLKGHLAREGTLGLEMAAKVMAGMIEALAYAEQKNLVHRDIKPENIMISEDGIVKLADFGIAQTATEGLVGEGTERDEEGRVKVMGTPRYMSPEQAKGRPLDPRCDQYSLGATFYHLLTGVPPYDRKRSKDIMRAHVFDPVPNPSEVVDLPRGWTEMLMRMMAKTPEERYPDVESLRDAFARAVSGRSGRRTSRKAPIREVSIDGPRSRFPIGSLLAILGVVAVGGILLWQLFAQQGESGGSELGGDGSGGEEDGRHSEEVKRRKAEEIITSLPADPEEAINDLKRELRNPYFRGSAALELLQEEHGRLEEMRKRSRRKRLDDLANILDEAASAAARGDFNAARTSVEGLSDEDRRLLGKRRLNSTLRTIADERRTYLKARLEAITGAPDLERLSEVVDASAEAGLRDGDMQRLRNAAVARREELEAIARAEAAEEASRRESRWRAFAEGLLPLRGDGGKGPDAPDFVRFASRAKQARDSFTEGEYAEFADSVAALGERARKVHRALEVWVESGAARVETEYGPAEVVELRGSQVTVRDEARGATVGHRLANVDWRGMAATAIAESDVDADRRQLHLAAYFWVWNNDLMQEYLLATRDHSQTASIMALEDTDLAGLIGKAAVYPFVLEFANPSSNWRQSVKGRGFAVADGVLRWTTDVQVPAKEIPEEGPYYGTDQLGSLSIDTRVADTDRIDCRVRVLPDSWILIGVGRSDGNRAMIAITTRKPPEPPSGTPPPAESPRIGVVLINEDSHRVDGRFADEPTDFEEEVVISALIEDDQIRFEVDGQPLVSSGTDEPIVNPLTGQGPYRFTVQSHQYLGTSGVEIAEVLVH